MAKKYYAIRKGFRNGVVNSWEECQKAINGFSGAEFRGFSNEEEAVAWLHGYSLALDRDADSRVRIERPTDKNTVNIYSDGTYKDGIIALGVYIESVDKGFSFYGAVSCGKYQAIANIAGELLGVLVGVQLARDLGFCKFNILYDYKGVEYWYNGTWQAKGQLQQLYVSLLNSIRTQYGVSYKFLKVKGHSGIEGNERADKLATRARNFGEYIDLDAVLRGTLTVEDVHIFR